MALGNNCKRIESIELIKNIFPKIPKKLAILLEIKDYN